MDRLKGRGQGLLLAAGACDDRDRVGETEIPKSTLVIGFYGLLAAAIGLVLFFSDRTSRQGLGWVVGILVVVAAVLGIYLVALGMLRLGRDHRPT